MSSVSTPTWAAGQVVNNTDVNSFFVPLGLDKTTATNRASNTTLAADPDLVLTVAANCYYEVTLVINNGSSGSTPGFKYTFNTPAGTTGQYTAIQTNLPGTLQIINSGWTTTNTASIDNGFFLSGMLVTGGTAGTFALSWAQNTSSATNTTVGASSYLIARRIA